MWLTTILVLVACSCVSVTPSPVARVARVASLWGPQQLELITDIENASNLKLLRKVIRDVERIVIFSADEPRNDEPVYRGYKGEGAVLHLNYDVYAQLIVDELKTKLEYVSLHGSSSEQEMASKDKFHSLELQYGEGRVLGVFLTQQQGEVSRSQPKRLRRDYVKDYEEERRKAEMMKKYRETMEKQKEEEIIKLAAEEERHRQEGILYGCIGLVVGVLVIIAFICFWFYRPWKTAPPNVLDVQYSPAKTR